MTSAQQIPSTVLAGGAELPMVGFGTWRLHGTGAYDSVRVALDAGCRHIDTASFYRNEAEVGRAIRDSGVPREDVFVTTKMWPDDAAGAFAALDASLRRLRMEFVDLWLIHWPPGGSASPGVWAEFIAARSRGQARAVGVSNYDLAQIDELTAATGVTPEVNQVPWSPSDHDPTFLDQLTKSEVIVEGYSPLKRTNLENPVLASIAQAHGVTAAQVVLRWHIEHGIVVIPKSATPSRIAANVDLFRFTLADDEIASIDALARAR